MISLPKAPKVTEQGDNRAVFVIDDCYPGYGMTLGNALRRVLLSSLPGSAVKAVRITGAEHEFSTLDNVKEDVVEIILNLKQLRLKKNSDDTVRGSLKMSGKKIVTAKDIEFPSDVEVVNPDLEIATLTDKDAKLEMELIVDHGLGYVSREVHREQGDVDAGMLVLDTFYTPVLNVNYSIENMRVGARTDYNRLRVSVKTDGTITPEDAFRQASKILVGQFQVFLQDGNVPIVEQIVDAVEDGSDEKKAKKSAKKPPAKKQAVELADLKLTTRITNVLAEHGIRTVDGLVSRGEAGLMEIPGLGEKAIKEIRRKIGRLGHILNK